MCLESIRDSDLGVLKELTMKLPPFPEVIEVLAECVEHKMSFGTSLFGTSLCWCLHSSPDISVARWFNSKGTEFPRHSHKQDEWLLPYVGSIFVKFVGNDEFKLSAGRHLHIPANTPHEARFDEDCWYLAICIPRNPDWPT